jgi:hypothetical protein
MLSHGLCDASQQEFRQPSSPVRTQNDPIRVPIGGRFQNPHPWLAFHHASLNLPEAGRAERFYGVTHELFRLAVPILHSRVLFKKGGAFDHMNHQNVRTLRTHLLCQDLCCSFGEIGTVDRQQYLHGNPLWSVHPTRIRKRRAGDCIAPCREEANPLHNMTRSALSNAHDKWLIVGSGSFSI